MSSSPFTLKVIKIIRSIPHGKVATYGGIATMAGNRRAARQVARILHSCSRKEGLPWHRVLNREGRISLARQQGYEDQKELLVNEGILFDASDRINLDDFLWYKKIV
nr:MGMT family protein [uncultured Pseudodesulfovibrio sp.]